MNLFSVLRIGFVEILYCVDEWVVLLSEFIVTKRPEQITIHARPVLNSRLQLRKCGLKFGNSLT
ncbi:hypothetical protein PMIT1323_01343 [Prochlorococcus marinus str. MIT 1323]|nr:hypothetical protein PMIT1323_01343 [Prochlorococcus marinus str. MIT 1323]